MVGLREWRHRRRLSIEELAKLAGVSNKTISDIENAKVYPKFRTMRRLESALELGSGEIDFGEPEGKLAA